MKIADLVAYTGGSDDGALRYYTIRDGFLVVAWTGLGRDDREGWWWAVVKPVAEHDLVLGCGHTAGLRAVQRDADIAAKLLQIAQLTSRSAEGLAS